MRIRRPEDELEPVLRATRPESKWRFISPLLFLILLVPCYVLAFACLTGQGPWAADGDFGPADLTQILVLHSPLALWAACWLLKWEGDHDIVEPRVVVAALASLVGLALCADLTVSLTLASLGRALN